MFGTISNNALLIIAGILAVFLIIFFILYIKGVTGFGMFIAVLIAATIAYFSLDAFNAYSTKQEKDNIKEAIMDNYNNAENILINKQDRKYKGYFSSDNENFSFEVIDNTLVIKNGETVVKSISGDNY